MLLIRYRRQQHHRGLRTLVSEATTQQEVTTARLCVFLGVGTYVGASHPRPWRKTHFVPNHAGIG